MDAKPPTEVKVLAEHGLPYLVFGLKTVLWV